MTLLSKKLPFIEKTIIRFTIALWFLISILSNSRSLLIGSIAVLLLYLFREKRKAFSSIKLYHLGILLSIILFSLAHFYKQDSSSGRLFIYKVSFNMFQDSGLAGIGMGKFKANYMHYQQHYFQTDPHLNTSEILLADNTYYLFNDYLQFILETGIMGALLVSLFCILVIKAFISFSLHRKSTLQNICIVILTPILIAALFNHFFEKTWVQLAFCLTFPIIIFDELGIIKNKNTVCLALYAVLFGAFFIFNKEHILFFRSHQQIKEAQALANCGYSNESLSLLDHTDIRIHKSVEYNLIYASLLFKTERYEQAIPYLVRTLKEFPSSDLYVLLAICLKNQKKYKAAEHYLTTACSMTPNRFSPREELLSLYILQNKTHLAKNEAAKILRLPVKVGSQKVESIRGKARNYLKLNQI